MENSAEEMLPHPEEEARIDSNEGIRNNPLRKECMKQPAPNAANAVKSLFNQEKASQSTAASVLGVKACMDQNGQDQQIVNEVILIKSMKSWIRS